LLIELGHPRLSVARQCALLGLARSSWYYTPHGERVENVELMCRMDEQYTLAPFNGIRRMTAWLRQEGYAVNHKRVRRLLRLMGLEALYPKPRLSAPGNGTKRYPYLLRGRSITTANEVWSTDITYIRMRNGFLYLVAALGWYSR
jgi:putative transposase